ncbi:MAG: hypothetical protein QXL94_01190 [Candidatus Parvarchaeum sp.]
MVKKNPVEMLVHSKKKKSKSHVRKGTYVCGNCGKEFGDEAGILKHMQLEGETMKSEENSRKEKIRKAIEERVKFYRVQKEEPEEDLDELEGEEEEESIDIDEIEEMLSEVLAIVRRVDAKMAGGKEVDVEEEEEFPDADEVKAAIATLKKYNTKLAKEERKAKPREPTESADTGEDEREVEENDYKDFETQGDEAPRKAKREVLTAEKANYKNEAGKAKELPEKSKLSQYVAPNETIPSESSVRRTASKGVQGKEMDVAGATSVAKSLDNSEYIHSATADILRGVKKSRDVISEITGGDRIW